jgi:multiple sugar transport system permease protein
VVFRGTTSAGPGVEEGFGEHQDALLTQGANGTTTLSLLAQQELTANRLIGLGSALSVLTFVIVMAVAFIYIRTVGGNIRALAEET